MTIKEAISEAKAVYNWSIVPHEPTSVRIEYESKRGTIQKTIFDLYSDDMEEELARLWDRLSEELGAKRDAVKSVEAYGYILD